MSDVSDVREWARGEFKDMYKKIDKMTADLAVTKQEVAVMKSIFENFAVSSKQDMGEIKEMIREKQAIRQSSPPKPPNIANQIASFFFSTKGVVVIIAVATLLFLNGELGTVLSKLLEK